MRIGLIVSRKLIPQKEKPLVSSNLPDWWPKFSKVTPPKPVKNIKLTILGCGTSTGIPILGCTCQTCSSKNPKNSRTRASILVQAKNKVFLIDTSPDLYHQAKRNKIFWIDAVLFTHDHADHCHGIDDLRTFNFIMAKHIDCYGNPRTIDQLAKKFEYIFTPYKEGGGKPIIKLHSITKPTTIMGIKIVPLEITHGSISILGYRINNIAYITDCSYIPSHTLKLLKGLDVLVLDCLRPSRHSTHFSLDEALVAAKKIGAKKTYMTHMGHELEYESFSKILPKGMYPAYDGLTIKA